MASTKSKTLVSLTSGLVALAAMEGALAAEEISQDEIVVVGARYPTQKDKLGNSITVLDEAFISARGAFRVSDLLRTVPGVAISRAGPMGALTQARLRGAEGSHTLVLIDGVQANDPMLGDEFNFAHLLTGDVERIEILRGPQSALYGGDAIGGVINIITRRGTDAVSGNAYVEGGSFGTLRLGGGVGGASDHFSFGASAAYLDSRGTDASPAGDEKDGYDNLTLNARAAYRPNKMFGLDASLRYVDATTESDLQDFDFFSPTFGQVVDADDVTKTKQFLAAVHGDLSLFDDMWRHDLSLSYSDHDNDFLTDGDLLTSQLSDRFRLRYQTALKLETENTSHQITGAVEFEDTDFESFAPDPDDPTNQKQSDDQLSLAAEYRIDLNEDVHLSGSIRHDNNDLFDNATSWNLTAAWVLPESGTRFHASAGKGVANPGFFELFGFLPGSFVPNPNLLPEKSFTFDVGIEQKFLDDRVMVDITYFNGDLKNEIRTIFEMIGDDFIATPVNEEGTSDRQGLEIAGSAVVTERFSVSGSYTYLDAKEPEDGLGNRLREVRRAKHIASLSGDFSFLDGRGHLHIGLDYNGKQQDTDFFVFPVAQRTLDDYLLVSANATYQITDSLAGFVRVQNMLDENYQEVLGFAEPGIGAFAGVRLTFGGK